jgi:hypothetical protein
MTQRFAGCSIGFSVDSFLARINGHIELSRFEWKRGYRVSSLRLDFDLNFV